MHVNQQAQASGAVWQEATERTLRVSELETANTQLEAATRRRDNVNAQLSNARRDLAALGGITKFNPAKVSDSVLTDGVLTDNVLTGEATDGQQAGSSQATGAGS